MGVTRHENLAAVRRSIDQDDLSLLNHTQLKMRERLEHILGHMLAEDAPTDRQLAKWIMSEYGVKETAAYGYLSEVKEVFAGALPRNRSVDAMLMARRVEKWIEETDLIDDPKERLETRAKLMRELARLRALDRGDDPTLDPDLLAPPKIEIALSKQNTRFLNMLLKNGVVDIPTPEIPEAEILEELPANPEQPSE